MIPPLISIRLRPIAWPGALVAAVISACALGYPAAAADVYLEPEAFLTEAFPEAPPKAEVLWITKEREETARRILGHDFGVLRQRYWRNGDQTAWILDEIGKEHPITTGLLVEKRAIKRIRVLVYRESRGWEVRYPFFTNQFDGATLTSDLELDRHIDGISGATLSVRALTRLARLALYFHGEATGAP